MTEPLSSENLPRILVVDADEERRRALAQVVEKLGDPIRTAQSGREALAALSRAPADLLLLDVDLPDGGSAELLSELRRAHPDLAVILVASHASIERAVFAVNRGASGCLLHPASEEELRLAVREALAKQRLLRDNRRLLQQAEQELARRRQAEEEREKLRTQLYQADRLASLGTLAASVAHEINNPLAYLLYNLQSLGEDLPKVAWLVDLLHQTLRERVGPEACAALLGDYARFARPELLEDLQARARDAAVGARKVQGIARDLRTFSHVQEDRRVPVSITQVLECAVNMAFNEIKYRARLVKEYGDTPTILASEGRLSQVFLNLLLNAAQAIGDGDAEHNEIRVRTWAERGGIRVEVRDTGCGISPEALPRIFDPFFTTKEVGTGSGLGLTICQSIVASYEGRIEVSPAPERGTRVVVQLPVRQPGADRPRSSTPPPGWIAPSAAPYGRVLVVDDEPNFGAAMFRMLRDEFTVVLASSGLEAQALLERDAAFDVILCDLLMPSVTGMALYDWLVSTRPDVARRMIFMTGGAFTPRAEEFLRRVPNLHLEKPFDVSYLRSLLLELLIRRS